MWSSTIVIGLVLALTIQSATSQQSSKVNPTKVDSTKGFPYEINNEIPQKYDDSSDGARLNVAPEKAVDHTIHGRTGSEASGESTMSAEDKSMHGCMDTMRGSNRNKHTPLSEREMESACEMYAQWGRSMREEPRWKPTAGQMQWWTSLGAKSRSHRIPGGRSPRQSGAAKARRQEYRMLKDTEREQFHEAVRRLKDSSMDGSSKYDLFVNFHQGNVAPGAHFGPGFLGYHREMLHRFELALREINPNVGLPYWDSNLDNHLGDDLAQVSMLWTPQFLGDGKGEVRSGPFAHWSLPNPVNGRLTLHRNLTVPPPTAQTEPALIPDRAIDIITSARSLRDLSWFVDPTFERHHGATHNWVGGVMGDLPNSPSDPVFFLHHAFIDCLWEQMRSRQRFRTPLVDPRFDYPNDSAALGVGIVQPDGRLLEDSYLSNHFAQNTMRPFSPLRNIDGLRDEYFQDYYTCEPSPRCSVENPSCGSPYLFCDLATHRCAPKLQLGADCSRFSGSDPCHGGACCSGRCLRQCSTRNITRTIRQRTEGSRPGDVDPRDQAPRLESRRSHIQSGREPTRDITEGAETFSSRSGDPGERPRQQGKTQQDRGEHGPDRHDVPHFQQRPDRLPVPHNHAHRPVRPRFSPRFSEQHTSFSLGSEFPRHRGPDPYGGPRRRPGHFNYFRNPSFTGPLPFRYRPFG